MKAISLKLFSASLLLTLMSACGGDKPSETTQQDKAPEAPSGTVVYKVGINTPYPPYIQPNDKGAYEGFDVDILNEIGRREGFFVDWQPRPWSGIYDLLNTSDIDIVASGGFDTEERRVKVAFSQPYNTETVVLITKDENAKTFNDARNKRVAYLAGGDEEAMVLELNGGKEPDLSLGTDSSWINVKKVIQGQADFSIDTSSIYAYYAKQYPDQKLYAIQQETPEVNNVAFGVKKDNTELLNKLNNGLNAIKADGTYDKIKSQWFASTTAQ